MSAPQTLVQRATHLFNKEIWRPEHLRDKSPRGLLYALLRVISITWTVFNETKAASRAAALSYSSLLGLGPLVAITMLVAGFVLDSKDPDLAVNTLNRMIKFVAPQVTLTEQGHLPASSDKVQAKAATVAVQPGTATQAGVQEASEAPKQVVQVNSDLVNLINDFIRGSKSGTASAVGVFSLVFIVLMLFTSVENAFNEIWGVRRGRSWLLRVVLYWTIVTLGALVFFASLTGLGASAFLKVFSDTIPFAQDMMLWLVPVLSVAGLVGVLTLFYRFVPNTHVFWRAALIGAIVVTALIFANNMLAFTYVRRVVEVRSLYGSVALIPILMLGLFIFWLFVLVGGQVSYAVQNVHFRNSQAAWGQLTEAMRERLSLVVLLSVCRRFEDCKPPLTTADLGDMLRVPTQIVNECINRLVDMGLVTPVPPAAGEPSSNARYLPAKPVGKITLQQFKNLDDNYGNDPTGEYLSRFDPVMKRYDEELDAALKGQFFSTPLSELLAEMKPAETHNAHAAGSNRKS